MGAFSTAWSRPPLQLRPSARVAACGSEGAELRSRVEGFVLLASRVVFLLLLLLYPWEVLE